MSHTMRPLVTLAAVLAAGALALALPTHAQQPASEITIIELTPHIAVNDAAALVEAQNYAGAIDLLDTFLENQPDPPPEAYYLLGVSHYQLGNDAQALPAAERAASTAADAPASWLELVAALYKRREDYRASIPWLERLIEKAAENKTYWLELSLAYEKIDDYDHALATMRLAQSAELLDADADYHRLSDLLVHNGLPRQGAEALQEGLDKRVVTADEDAYTKIGTAWFTAGEPDEAVLPLENASRLANNGDGYVRLAVVHVARRDWTAAVAALHAGMGRGGLTDEAQANLLMGVALYGQGKFDEAREWLTMAAESPLRRPAATSYLQAIDARSRAPAL